MKSLPKIPKAAMDELCDELEEVLIHKVAAYGKKSISKFKHHLIVPRLDSKKERLVNLTSSASQATDMIEDTVFDIFGYCIIWNMVLHRMYENATVRALGEKEKQGAPVYEDVLDTFLVAAKKKAILDIKRGPYHHRANLRDILNRIELISKTFTDVDFVLTRVNLGELVRNIETISALCLLYILKQRGKF